MKGMLQNIGPTQQLTTRNVWSFGTSGQYVSFPSNANYNIGTNSFTMECWVQFTSVTTPSAGAVCFMQTTNNMASATGPAWFGVTGTSGQPFSTLWMGQHGGSNVSGGVAWTPKVGVWYHVAVFRNGTTSCQFFVNGQQVGAAQSIAANYTAQAGFAIGSLTTSPSGIPFPGKILDVRYTLGTGAPYSSNFTPPVPGTLAVVSGCQLLSLVNASGNTTLADQSANAATATNNGTVAAAAAVINSTSFGVITDPYFFSDLLLVHGEGVDTGVVIQDSAKGWALTPTGVTTSATQAKFGSTSLSFPGSNNTGLATPVSQAFTFGSGQDFSIEFWMYPTTAVNTIPLIMTNNNNVTINNNHWYLHYNRTGLAPNAPNALQWFHDAISTTVAQITTPAIIVPNTGWYFIQLCRTGNTYTIYVGGVNCGSYTSATALDDGTTPQAIYFGGQPAGTNVGYAGFLDEIRISKMNRQPSGLGVSVPTAAFPASVSGGDSCFPSVNGSYALDTDVADPSAVLGTLTLTNTAALSNATSKFGTNSLGLTQLTQAAAIGTAVSWASSANSVPALGTQDFTIECWMYPTGTRLGSLSQTLFSVGSSSGTRFDLAWDTSGGSMYFLWNGTVQQTTSTAGIALSTRLNTWTHFCMVRVANVIKIYLNGVQVNTNFSFASSISAAKLNIGSLAFNPGSPSDYRPWIGYIANFRISVGVARYPVFPMQIAASQDLATS